MVTNLFRPLSRPTGEFFLFSNYADDLTRQATMPKNYRVVPSKFAALQLDTTQISQDYSSEIGLGIGSVLQDYYENKSNFLHTYDFTTTSIPYYKWWDSRVVWQTLMKFGLIHTDTYVERDENQNEVSSFDYFPELHYIGDVNIYSTTETDGRAYNEIYCYIPNDAQDTVYAVHNIGDHTESFKYTDVPGVIQDGSEPNDPVYTLIGWNHDNYPQNNPIGNTPMLDDTNSNKYNIYDNDYWYRPDALFCEWSNGVADLDDVSTNLSTALDNTMFEVNSVLVFYDVISIDDKGTETVKHKNLPLGIYFTGYDPDHGLSNTIQKYVNSDDIYEQGTSYGLRICNRFVSTPNATTFYDTNIDLYDGLADFSHAMELMGENAALMQEIARQNETTYNGLNDHLAQFKNYRTNVPYIRQLTVNGDQVGVWFVNGRNTGQIAGTYVNRTTQSDWECEDESSPAYIQNRPDMVTLRGILCDDDEIMSPEDDKGLNIKAGSNITLTTEPHYADPNDPNDYDYESVIINSTGGGGGAGAPQVIEYETGNTHIFGGTHSNRVMFDNTNTNLFEVSLEDGITSGAQYKIAIRTGMGLKKYLDNNHLSSIDVKISNIDIDKGKENPMVIVRERPLQEYDLHSSAPIIAFQDYRTPDPNNSYINIRFDQIIDFMDYYKIAVGEAPSELLYMDITFIVTQDAGKDIIKYVLFDFGWGDQDSKFSTISWVNA